MRTTPTRIERQARTRAELVDAAERLFSDQGFDRTSLHAVADAAGYTKGAVYSNFASKEDVFFAVYERRVERYLARAGRLIEQHGPAEGMRRVAADVVSRRGDGDDGWLTVFLEFWTHVLRHPEHRARFAEIHGRAVAPLAANLERLAADRRAALPVPAERLAVAIFAMQTGLSLERLTQPALADGALGVQMFDLWMELLVGDREAPAEPEGASDGADV
jgi:AcrR family transcriptional regulator